MSFASPIWLLGVVPWVVLALWLLTGQRQRAEVPFVSLWETEAPPPRKNRAFHPPPLSLVLLMLAMLLAIVGAAGPMVAWRQTGPRVTIIVDRDVTTSARLGNATRLAATRAAAAEALRQALGPGPTTLIAVPGGTIHNSLASDRLQAAQPLQPSSIRTQTALNDAIHLALRSGSEPLIVLSDQQLDANDERLVQIGLPSEIQNAGIVRLGARTEPVSQVMIVVRNQSQTTKAELVVRSEGRSQKLAVQLPPRGREESFFVELPRLGRSVAVELVVDDQLAADNFAWLMRQRSWARIEPRGVLPTPLQRIIDVYQRMRPSDDGSARVVVSADEDAVLPEEPAALLSAAEAAPAGDRPPQVAEHPITADVDWNQIAPGARVGGELSKQWQPLVRSGDRTLLAVREQPARQVRINFSSDSWGQTSDFVVFWSNVFNWLGQSSSERYTWESPQSLEMDWTRRDDLSGSPPLPLAPPPGIYAREDGALRAINAIDLVIAMTSPTDWQTRLTRVPAGAGVGLPAAPAVLVAGLTCALLGALTWNRKLNRTHLA